MDGPQVRMTDHLQRLTQAAHTASTAITGMPADLAIVAMPSADLDERLAALERALRRWPSLAEAMAELERAAPNTARKAYDHMDRIKDFAERTTHV